MSRNEVFEGSPEIQRKLFELLETLYAYAVYKYRKEVADARTDDVAIAQRPAAQTAYEQAEAAVGTLFEDLGLDAPTQTSIAQLSDAISISRIVFNPQKCARNSIGVWYRDPQTEEQRVIAADEPYTSGPFAVYTCIQSPTIDDRNLGIRVYLSQLPDSICEHVGLVE